MSHHFHSRRKRLVALVAAAALGMTTLAACGSSADPATDSPASDTATSSWETTAETTPAVTSAPADTSSEQAEPTDAGDGESADGTSYPVTITADNGEVTLDAQPNRIVSLSPTTTEMLYAIGAGEQVVAVEMNSNYPEDLPDERFDAYQISVEAISAIDPDLVISSFVSEDQLAQFAKLDIPVVWHNAATIIEDTYRQITDLGALTGHVDEASDLVSRMQESIAKITSDAPVFDPPATYFYELDDTLYSVTSSTFMGSVLGLLGMQSIADSAEGAAESGGYPQLSAEFIVDANPDYIFLSDAQFGVSTDDVAARPGWSTMDAVMGDRVIPLDGDLASRWGPRIVDLLSAIVDAVEAHPAQR